MELNMTINGLYVTKIISFKKYMEDICGFIIINDNTNSTIYQNGYFFNPNNGWMHISCLGNQFDIHQLVRSKKIDEVLEDNQINNLNI